MRLDDYQKIGTDILQYLEIDSTIFIINKMQLLPTIALAKTYYLSPFYDIHSYQFFNVTKSIPNIIQEIRDALPYPISASSPPSFTIEIISQYGVSWIPIASPLYQLAISSSVLEHTQMLEWQRLIRSSVSNDIDELTFLSLDPVSYIRESALLKLKTSY